MTWITALMIIALVSIPAIIAIAIAVEKKIPLWRPIVDWMQWIVRGSNSDSSFFSMENIKKFLSPETDEKKLQQLEAEVDEREDEDYRHQILGEADPDKRRQLMAQQRQMIRARRRRQHRNVGSILVVIFCMIAIIPTLIGSYFFKMSVAKEFLLGSANLVNPKINAFGFVFELDMTTSVSILLIFFEITCSIVLAKAITSIKEIKEEKSDESTAGAWVQVCISTLVIICIVVLEGVMGFYRAIVETGGDDLWGSVFLIGASAILPVVMVLLTYTTKTALQQTSGLFSVVLRWGILIIGAILSLFILPIILTLTLTLTLISLLILLPSLCFCALLSLIYNLGSWLGQKYSTWRTKRQAEKELLRQALAAQAQQKELTRVPEAQSLTSTN